MPASLLTGRQDESDPHVFWKQLEARGDWAVRFPANSGVVFSMIASGRCVFQTAGREPQTLREGDFLLLAQPPVWSLGRDAGSIPRDFDPAKIDPEARLTRIGEGDGPATRILGGRFVFDESNAALLKGVLPTAVEIRSAEAARSACDVCSTSWARRLSRTSRVGSSCWSGSWS